MTTTGEQRIAFRNGRWVAVCMRCGLREPYEERGLAYMLAELHACGSGWMRVL